MIHLDTYDIMHQTCIWKTKDGEWFRINLPEPASRLSYLRSDIARLPRMEKSHAENLIAWLDKSALRIQIANFACAQAWLADPYMSDTNQMLIEADIEREFDPEPLEWLHETPLYKALKEYIDAH